MKFNFKGFSAFKLALLGTGACLLLTPQIFTPLTANAMPTSGSNQGAVSNNCLNDVGDGFSVETTYHIVGICYNMNGAFYVSYAKDGSGSIILPLTDRSGNVYVANNNGYTYILDMNKQELIIKSPNGNRYSERVKRVIDS